MSGQNQENTEIRWKDGKKEEVRKFHFISKNKLLKTGIKSSRPVQANGQEKSQDDEGEESER